MAKSTSHLFLYDRNAPQGQVEYLIRGVLPRRGLVVLNGASGTGKSQLAIRMAACLAVGHSLGLESQEASFGHTDTRGSTAYVVGEGKDYFTSRLNSAEEALLEGERVELFQKFNGRLPIISIGISAQLSEANEIDELAHLISEGYIAMGLRGIPLRLLIFDTLISAFFVHDENNNSQMQRLVTALQAYARYFDCCVLVVAHPPKSSDGPKGYTRGASALFNGADVVIELEKINASGHRTMRIAKMRDGDFHDSKLTLQIKSFETGPAIVPAHRDADNSKASRGKVGQPLTERQSKVLEILKDTPQNKISTKELLKRLLQERQLKNPDVSIKRSSEARMIRRDVKALVKLNRVKVYEPGSKGGIELDEANLVEDATRKYWAAIAGTIPPPPNTND